MSDVKLLKHRLAAGETTRVFAMARLVDPVVVEMFRLAGGYHGYWLDLEHAEPTMERITACSLAARGCGFDSFVRLPPAGYWRVTQCLEAGCGGAMAAQIRTVDEAARFVSWCRFPPKGARGLNLSGMDSRYSLTPAAEFVADAESKTLIGIQVETAEAVEAVGDLAALDGLDLLFIGPADLSLSLGVCGQFHSDTLWEAILRVAEACRQHGVSWGCVAPDKQFADRALENGCRMLTLGNDVIAMRRGIAAIRESFGQ